MDTTSNPNTTTTEAIYQINLILSEEGGGYTFASPGWDWDEVLEDSWSDISDNPIERVGFKVPGGTEVSFRASTLRAALGMAVK